MSSSNKPIRIAVVGASGRMGRKLIQAVTDSEQAKLSVALNRANSVFYGLDAGKLVGIGDLGVTITSDISSVSNDFDILIDFTSPETSLKYLDFCRLHQKGIVIGTTGFSDRQKEIINAAAKEIGIVFTANFSVGVNLMLKLLEKATQIMGEEADIEIIEAHHRQKVDAPSGTALAIGETIASVLGLNLTQCGVYSRHGHTGERQVKSIGFATVRAGDIIGEHTAMFAGLGERLEITHKASSRMTFAIGAVRAAVWLASQKNGLFNMVNVLNLDKL
ncbi:Dihydrodipicolinate reductase [Candidatus Moranella endobia PCVAL]|uniref:4-hydroxy-tetrahydrodipicolinate reductase n=1 Tax=Candidatus Moranella endobia TaxID=1048758 RepID=UPI0002C6D8F6|nr:4-hydroxy-tetrahydrodipicolinate reductase [Candidatus Moranella endobia]AGJ61397.1 Dihydrodipicolinate reductase [Candidatus Moranella endobia PCVAL]